MRLCLKTEIGRKEEKEAGRAGPYVFRPVTAQVEQESAKHQSLYQVTRPHFPSMTPVYVTVGARMGLGGMPCVSVREAGSPGLAGPLKQSATSAALALRAICLKPCRRPIPSHSTNCKNFPFNPGEAERCLKPRSHLWDLAGLTEGIWGLWHFHPLLLAFPSPSPRLPSLRSTRFSHPTQRH